MELIVYLIWLFVVGLIVGALARLIVPGRTSMGLLGTSLAGIGGAFLAGLISWYLIQPRSALVGFILAVLCAAVIVYFVAGRRRRARF